MNRYYTVIASPIGEITLTANDRGLTGVYTAEHRLSRMARQGIADPIPFQQAVRQLEEYFAGKRTRFDLTLAPEGTDFQQKVWRALAAIPFGDTRSYGALAAALGKPSAARAVGLANGRNPISIIVPCHRVIGANGKPTGYAGGIPAKEWLLKHEGRKG